LVRIEEEGTVLIVGVCCSAKVYQVYKGVAKKNPSCD
jgi:hypothetical protein